MALLGKLAYRDGYLCFVLAEPMFDEPTLVTNWWRLERDYPGQRDSLDLTDAPAALDATGTVHFRIGAAHTDRRLPQGAATKADHADRSPIPCPRVKPGIETRYWRGRWEKRLARGWTPA
jgi:hypothetical protein